MQGLRAQKAVAFVVEIPVAQVLPSMSATDHHVLDVPSLIKLA